MQRKEEMTLKEVIEYVKSLKALNREIPEDFRKQHEKTLLAMKDSDSLAKPEQKAPTKGDLLVAKKDFVHKKRQGHFSKNSKAKDGVHHSAHHRTLKNR